MKFITQLLEVYNDATQRFEDWTFKRVVPPVLKIIEIALRLTLIYSFYLLVVNAINEIL